MANATIINVVNQGAYLSVVVSGRTARRLPVFNVMVWRARHPGCVIFIDGKLCEYGAWAD